MQFPVGSRAQLVFLRFKVGVKWSFMGQGNNVTLLSEFSGPLVVTTSEYQWGPMMGKVMAVDFFGEDCETNQAKSMEWTLFVNKLQWYYLEVTRQDKKNPPRPLSLHDISYLHQFKFNNSSHVTYQTFMSFWNWFGVVMVNIRHSRLLNELWTKGYLMGFIRFFFSSHEVLSFFFLTLLPFLLRKAKMEPRICCVEDSLERFFFDLASVFRDLLLLLM